ncbi:MAG: substrate-binding domain-containing protein, partial [Pirellulaceae bacterium]
PEIETTENDVVGTIGYSAMSFKNPFFVVIKENLEDAANAARYELIANDADSDVSKQANHIDEFISKGVSAIVLNPTDKLAIGEAIKKANAAGIPVFTCDLQCTAEGVEIAGHIGTDNYQGGTLAGQAMVEILGEQGGEVLVLDYKQANSCVLRVDGFMEVIDKHNGDREEGKIQIIAEVNGGGDEDIGYKATTDLLVAHPNIAGVFAINDPSALGAWKAIDEAGKTEQITIVGFDGAKAGKQAILEGKIYADPIQYPVKMGREIMAKILAYQNGEDFEALELIPTTLYRKADAEMDPELQQ